MTDSQLIRVTLSTLTYGGDAMGRLPDGRAVFVQFGLPGETVRARTVEGRKGFVRAVLVDVIGASPERIKPRCPHFAACGGCHYQNMPYAAQLRAKTDILLHQLTRIGKIANPPVKRIVPAPDEWNYRNNVQFHLDKTGKPGYISANDPQAVLPITECHLPEAGLNALWPTLEFEPDTPVERISLRAGTNGEALLVLESDSEETPEVEIEADISVVHLTDDDAVVIAGDEHIVIEVLGRPFKVSAGSFFQVNTKMAAKMVEHVLACLPAAPACILDVYCGVGLFSAFLAPRCERLIGIEVSPSACDDFTVNLDEFDNVELYEAPAEDVLPTLKQKTNVVLVDPPRAGLDKKVLDALVALAAKTIIYVSCDPATLARDASRLIAGGYKLRQVTPFDLFPQTYHIESISVFER
jgi:23S rRNA (uracil1939-C5)-methyltransferase